MSISECFKSSPSNFITPFFGHAISYEMGKNNLDARTLQDYLSAVDDTLPEALCEKIDEIEDLHIIDVELINKTEEYAKFYSKYNPILREINYASDIAILEVLHPLVEHYEEFPKETEYFQ